VQNPEAVMLAVACTPRGIHELLSEVEKLSCLNPHSAFPVAKSAVACTPPGTNELPRDL